MELRKKYIDSINKLLKEVNFVELWKSCNRYDQEYAQGFLRKMHQAFVDTYGSDFVNGEVLGLIDLPAVLRGKKSGMTYLGLVTVDLESSGEHYNTVFFTDKGVLDQMNGKRDDPRRKPFFEQLGSYDYWYTPEIPMDIHVDYEYIPNLVERLLRSCVGMEPTQQMNGIQ